MVAVYGAMAITFFAIDLVRIAVVANAFYRRHRGFMLRGPTCKWVPTVLCYLLFVLGVLIFVVLPAVGRQSLGRAVVYGALFGLVVYATYDLTNLALTKGFLSVVALVDLTWGATIAAVVAAAGYGGAMSRLVT